MNVSVANQVRECTILLAYARQTKTTAEGDLVYWTGQTTAADLRARTEVIRAREAITACDTAIGELERSRDAALSGLDVADPLRSARKVLDRLVNCHVRQQYKFAASRRVRALSADNAGHA